MDAQSPQIFTSTGGKHMADSQPDDLWHVVLTPAGVQSSELAMGMDEAQLDEYSLEVCHMEAVGQDRAEELMDLFARMSTGGEAGHQHGSDPGPCPICSPSQRDLVSDAVRRALWRDPW
jgi:hypothetical protein